LADGPDKRGPYALTTVQHSAVQTPDYFSNQRAAGQAYTNNVICVSQQAPYRPARLTPKPVIQGVQTAVVVGDAGKEIDVDQYGRVLVQFPWDRLGKKDGGNSCRIRVAQQWAGNRWGFSFWPRVGQEVIVAFSEGDPEQPVVVGSLYNNIDQMPPYLGDLANNKPGPDPKHPNDPKVSGVKTCTTPGGKGFNELRFNDTQGKEQVFIRSQGAMDVRVLGTQRSTIGGNQDVSVGGSTHEKVAKDKDAQVGGDIKTEVQGRYALFVTKDVFINSNAATEIGSDGNYHISSQAKILIESPVEIGLVCGGNFITLTPDGIFISAPAVAINSGGDATQLDPIPDSDIPDAPKDPAGADEAKSGAPSTKPS
jgi:type VI secretion system secreted protein VgrG